MTSYLEQPLGEFLDRLAARTPAPGGGGAAATTAAMAAGLVAMAARFSATQLPDAGALAGEADRLRSRAARLADADAGAYAAVLDAFRRPREGPPADGGPGGGAPGGGAPGGGAPGDGGPGDGGPGEGAPGERDRRIREALRRAAEIPEEMTQIAARVAGMAARLAAAGNPNLRGDSVSAALLAEAAARSAASLVSINVTLGKLDAALSDRAARNASAATAAATAAQQATS